MRKVAIIQARMSSTRLPGKVLKEIEGYSLLKMQIERLKLNNNLDEIVVATTDNPSDQVIIDFCKRESISFYVGSEEDVLSRYYYAAIHYDADVVIRMTADCPIIDSNVVNKVLDFFINNHEKYDYVSNGLIQSYPRGMDTEVFSFRILEEAFYNAHQSYEREHVTAYIYDETNGYKLKNIPYDKDYSNYRLTVDTPEDLELVTNLLEIIIPSKGIYFTLEDIVEILDENPELVKINSKITQKSVFEI